ncbi:MAG TPA: YiaA/YiaB family inner membrane protein, partial [Acidimicrobiales bacterium]
MTQPKIQSTNTTAFYTQACVSFAVSFSAVLAGIAYLPLNGWVRAFLALGSLYLVTSTFTLAKCVRDKEEAARVVARVDDARMERFLAEHDPLRP